MSQRHVTEAPASPKRSRPISRGQSSGRPRKDGTLPTIQEEGARAKSRAKARAQFGRTPHRRPAGPGRGHFRTDSRQTEVQLESAEEESERAESSSLRGHKRARLHESEPEEEELDTASGVEAGRRDITEGDAVVYGSPTWHGSA